MLFQLFEPVLFSAHVYGSFAAADAPSLGSMDINSKSGSPNPISYDKIIFMINQINLWHRKKRYLKYISEFIYFCHHIGLQIKNYEYFRQKKYPNFVYSTTEVMLLYHALCEKWMQFMGNKEFWYLNEAPGLLWKMPSFITQWVKIQI